MSGIKVGTAAIVGLLLVAYVQPASLPEYRIFEGELTELLTKFLMPLDPATLQEAHIVWSNENFIDVQLALYAAQCKGFSAVEVTLFEPPLPLVSNKMKLRVKMDSVDILADPYNLSGTVFGRSVEGSGALSLTMEGLVSQMSFETDEFSSDPMRVCVRYDSFNIVMTADSVEGTFEGMPLVNSNMDVIGPLLLKKFQKYFNDKGHEVEEAINDILCT